MSRSLDPCVEHGIASGHCGKCQTKSDYKESRDLYVDLNCRNPHSALVAIRAADWAKSFLDKQHEQEVAIERDAFKQQETHHMVIRQKLKEKLHAAEEEIADLKDQVVILNARSSVVALLGAEEKLIAAEKEIDELKSEKEEFSDSLRFMYGKDVETILEQMSYQNKELLAAGTKINNLTHTISIREQELKSVIDNSDESKWSYWRKRSGELNDKLAAAQEEIERLKLVNGNLSGNLKLRNQEILELKAEALSEEKWANDYFAKAQAQETLIKMTQEALNDLIKYDVSPEYGDSKMSWDKCVAALAAISVYRGER